MRLVVAGSPAAAVPTLSRLVADGHDIAAVVTRPPMPQGRKRVLTETPVAAAATAAGIPVIPAARVDDGVTARIAALNADLGVIVAYGGLLRRPALNAPARGWINLHFSDLPAYRGAAPVQRAIIAGETRTAVTVFQLVEALDAGPVFATEPFDIGPDASSGDVLVAMSERGAGVVSAVVASIAAGTANSVEQRGVPTSAPKLTLADGHIDFCDSAVHVHNRIRGTTPEPGAFAYLDDVRVKLLRSARVVATAGPDGGGVPVLSPGALAVSGGAVLVGTTDEPVSLTVVQPAGKRPMDAVAWVRGLGSIAGRAFA